ncbi:hypothetical protein [Thalassiella azotivora]
MSRLLTAGAAALAASGAWTLRRRVPGGAPRWDRTNHRGRTLSLLEGPAWTLGAAAGTALAPGLPPAARAGAVLAVTGAGFFGAVDDLTETGSDKGLRGHLGALARGRLTTGGLKVLGIGATGLAAARLLTAGEGDSHGVRRAVEVVVAGGVVAGAANLANLLDLRPGRVLKVTVLTAPALLAGPVSGPLAAAAVGAGAGVVAPDLGERAMLGDCGANAAGALLGAAAVTRLGPGGRAGVLAGLVALTLASERVSFTRVIERTPVLRELDALGRRRGA